MTAPSLGPEDLPELSNAEWEVMKTLWEKGPMAARDVYAALPDGHGWAYSTVKTLLSRLVAKGAVDYEQVGNSYLYRTVRSREQLTHKEIKGFLERVTDGSLSTLVAHFVEGGEVSDEELARLKEILESGKKGSPGKTRRKES
jgi:BlaI family penicillinase repressor